MFQSMLKVAAATSVFAIVHSALASSAAKRTAAKAFGERNRNGLYRVFYLTQAAISCGVLLSYIRRQPSRELYRMPHAAACLAHAAHAGTLVYATSAARQIGIRRVLGLESFQAWLRNSAVPVEPAAQGPALDERGRQHAIGPFVWSRHPLNFAPLPIFWLWPRMTTNLLAFNVAATIYLLIGSWHEETRLREAYGEAYDAYIASGVSFYIPRPTRTALQSTGSIVELGTRLH